MAKSHSPTAGSRTREAALLRPMSLPDDKTFSKKCKSTFLMIWEVNMFLSCTGSVVPGRAKLRSNLSTHARLRLRMLGIPHSFYKFASLHQTYAPTCQGSRTSFMLTPARRRPSAQVSSISLWSKGLASRRKPQLIGCLGSARGGCLCSITRTIRPSTFTLTYPPALTVIS